MSDAQDPPIVQIGIYKLSQNNLSVKKYNNKNNYKALVAQLVEQVASDVFAGVRIPPSVRIALLSYLVNFQSSKLIKRVRVPCDAK